MPTQTSMSTELHNLLEHRDCHENWAHEEARSKHFNVAPRPFLNVQLHVGNYISGNLDLWGIGSDLKAIFIFLKPRKPIPVLKDFNYPL